MFEQRWCVVLVIPGFGLDIVTTHRLRAGAVLASIPYAHPRIMLTADAEEINRIYWRVKNRGH